MVFCTVLTQGTYLPELLRNGTVGSLPLLGSTYWNTHYINNGTRTGTITMTELLFITEVEVLSSKLLKRHKDVFTYLAMILYRAQTKFHDRRDGSFIFHLLCELTRVKFHIQ